MTLTLPAGTNKVRFAGVTAFGNNLYLDNVKIYDRFLDGLNHQRIPLLDRLPVRIQLYGQHGLALLAVPMMQQYQQPMHLVERNQL